MIMKLEIKTEDERKRLLSQIIALKPDKIFIWGNGTYSQIIREFIVTEGNFCGKFLSIIDDEYYKIEELDCIPFSKFLAIKENKAPIVFGFYNYFEIQRKRDSWSNQLINLYEFHFVVVHGRRLEWNPILAKIRESEYRKTYELLGDEKSRKVMQLYLDAAIAGEFNALFTECYEKPSYFNSITKNLKIDTLIDCGAYDGDSIHDFINVFQDYKKIIAIEPDSLNCKKLKKRKIQEKIRELVVIRKGIGAHKGALRFHNEGASSSYLSETGDIEIQITTLDAICDDITGIIMIKMDIEGAELEALKGAQKLIKEKSPILAICVYHNERDLIDIPKIIHETAGNGVYDYFLGFHGFDLAELVFYAVPKKLKERL